MNCVVWPVKKCWTQRQQSCLKVQTILFIMSCLNQMQNFQPLVGRSLSDKSTLVSSCVREKKGLQRYSWSKFGLLDQFCQVFTARCYASAVLAMGLCLSVCPSVRHKSVSYRNDWTNRAVFGMWAFFHPSYVLKGNSIISKNKGTSLWNFVLNSGLQKLQKILPWHIDCRNVLST